MNENVWQHVAFAYDRSGPGFIRIDLYIDGVLVQTLAGFPQLSGPDSDDPLHIGVSKGSDGTFTDFFQGQIDELGVHSRALTEAEIYSIYLRELRWYRDSAISFITVDTDAPTIELLSDHSYRANGYIQLVVSALDATSHVTLLDFGLKAPGDDDFTWTTAPVCEEAAATRAAWCPSFDSSQLGGEGEYQLQFRAVDTVGNETTSIVYNLYVDDGAPTVSSRHSGDLERATAIPNQQLAWIISLSGNISDPDISTGVPGSGVETDEVMVSLVDVTGEVLNGAPQRATVSLNFWNITYEAHGVRPAGTYTIQVMAKDLIGNETITNVGTIGLDVRPPNPEVYGRFLPELMISNTITLSGTVSEQANWGGGVAEYHFEETAGSTTFYDSSGEENNATCTNCPTVTGGLFGQALDFDGVDDYAVIPTVINPISDAFTAAA